MKMRGATILKLKAPDPTRPLAVLTLPPPPQFFDLTLHQATIQWKLGRIGKRNQNKTTHLMPWKPKCGLLEVAARAIREHTHGIIRMIVTTPREHRRTMIRTLFRKAKLY